MNKETILKMLEYSAFAYNDIQPKDSNQELYVINDRETDVQCYIRNELNTLYISFRGTDSNIDRKTDLKFWQKTIPYGNHESKIRVHSGFLKSYKNDNVRLNIHKLIKSNINKINIMGHSYGAALAVLCAVDLQYNFPDKNYEVFLFGCPRVGNRHFKKSYDKRVFKTFRVVNGNDAITKIPFALLGYRHVGIKTHVGATSFPFAFSFNQHRIQFYYSNLLKSSI